MRVEAEAASSDHDRYERHYVEHWGTRDLTLPVGYEDRPNDLRRATRFAFEQLGELDGRALLELGAGSGIDSVTLARRGAIVTATDHSEASVQVMQRRFAANEVADRARAVLMSAEALTFPDASFDLVFARGVLHHTDVHRVAPHVARVLRPNGRAVFIEPLSENPVLDFAREHLRYRHKTRPRGHRGITRRTVRALQPHFTQLGLRGFYLSSMLNRVFGFDTELQILERADEWLLERAPIFTRLCRYAVVSGVR
jgi:SAM-dependent methyltransferase